MGGLTAVADEDAPTEPWGCLDCGHRETGPVDGVTGAHVEKTIGSGCRSKTIETVVCPACGSEDWYSQSVAEAFVGEFPAE